MFIECYGQSCDMAYVWHYLSSYCKEWLNFLDKALA